jgi:SP family general alpha glucoside:H+ symporter-like MFS transporter
MIKHTNELETQLYSGISYFDCLKSSNRRRTEIACVVYVAQVFCGIWFGGNVVYFLEQAGFDPERAFDFGLGTASLALVGTISAWYVMTRVGRRRLYLVGLSIMFTILLAVGFMGIPPAGIPTIGYTSGALMMIFTLTFDWTVAPVAYCLIAEIPSTRLRIKTAVLARNAYNIASIIANCKWTV